MRPTVLLGLILLVLSGASCKDIKDRIRLFRPLKDKRGAADHPSGYSPHPYNLNSFALPNLPGHNLGGYGSGYILPPSLNAGLGHGFNFASGLGHGSSYSTPGLFTPSQSKTGPVTFGHGPGFPSPLYVTAAMQDLVKYAGQGSQGLQILLGSPLTSSQKTSIPSSSGHQSQLTSSADSSNTVTGGYVIAGASNDASYIIPMSSSSASSHGSSAYSVPSSSYSSGSSHVGLSSGSADSSSYSLPISSSNYPVSTSSKKYIPVSSSGSTYSTANSIPSSTSSASYSLPGANYDKTSSAYSSSASYSSPVAAAYSSPSKNYDASSSYLSSNYPSSGTSYSGPTVTYVAPANQQSSENIGHAGASSNYPKSVSGYFASPSTSYTDSSSSYPGHVMSYSSQGSSYASPTESGSYSNLVPQYLSYSMEKPLDSASSSSSNYDTISYSTASGKYS